MTSPCQKFQPMLEAYVDGELSVDHVLDVERHLSDCGPCQEVARFDRALKRSVREVVRQAAEVAPAFRNELETVLCAERRRLSARRLPVWRARSAVPLAAAAVVAFFVVSRSRSSSDEASVAVTRPSVGTPTRRPPDIQPALDVDEFLDDVVAHHARDTEPEVTEPLLVPGRFEREVGVPVQVPSLRQYGALWEGGSVVPVRETNAALLRYKLDGHRITVYVYDSGRMPLRARLEPRVVRNEPVYVGTRSGYSIAAREQRGIGYAVATDLGLNESAELVADMH